MRENDDSLKSLASYILEKGRNRDRPKMTSPSTPGGGSLVDERRDGLPLPLGTEGQVLTIADVGGGLLVPTWETPVGGTGSQYRYHVVVANDEGGFQIVNDGAGNPTYILMDLE